MIHDINIMIIISIISALLSSMNIWCVSLKHIRLHLNDLYMAFLMTGWMMLLSYLYYDIKNYKMILIFLFIICVSIYMIRKQIFINNRQYINGMIPHHSMAILMSNEIKKKSNDDDIIKLASNIIDNQHKEIGYMEKLQNI